MTCQGETHHVVVSLALVVTPCGGVTAVGCHTWRVVGRWGAASCGGHSGGAPVRTPRPDSLK